jgi:hypothetical protein
LDKEVSKKAAKCDYYAFMWRKYFQFSEKIKKRKEKHKINPFGQKR